MTAEKKNRGFSLVELIVTLAIMAVLVGILAPTLLRYVEKSRVSKDEAAMGEFLNALYLAAADLEVYDDIPASGQIFECAEGSDTFTVKPAAGANSFETELASTVGDKLIFTSKKWKQATIKVTVNPTWDTIKVEMTPEDLMTNYTRWDKTTEESK